MKKKANIKFTAAALMLVFSLNIVFGFLCSIGVDMGYNSAHHEQTESIHLHSSASHDNKDTDSQAAGKHNQEQSGSGSHSKSTSNPKDCCQTGVLQLTQLDKVVPANHVAHVVAVPFIVPPVAYSSTLYKRRAIKDIKQFVRSDHPPIISDVRIAIKSFQI